MTGFCKSRTGTWKGSGRRWRGADGPGGCDGMFAGSEGPELAAGGRYEGRQTRQALSVFFWHFLAESCAAAPTWQHASAKTGVAGGATRSFLDISYSERTKHPESGDLAGAGAITAARPMPSCTSLAHTGLRRGSAWDFLGAMSPESAQPALLARGNSTTR